VTGLWMPRRSLLAALAAAPLAGVRAQAESPEAAAAFIQQAGSDLARVVSGAESVPEKRQRLLPFLDRTVDVNGVARFCLGRFWQAATPEQRAEYLRLFRFVLANGVAGRLGDYQQGTTTVATGRPEVREDGISVPTTVTRGSNLPNRVTWLVVPTGDGFRIADVTAEGVSLRLTQRQDYASYLSRNGGDVGALIRAMAAQVAQLQG
jgi:phospholipid transport system substrate-binding protein